MKSGNYDSQLKALELRSKERSLGSRERRLEKRGLNLLRDSASVLRNRGCLVYLPGEWPRDTSAKEMVEVMARLHAYVDRALRIAYDRQKIDPGLTPKSYQSGELSIGDLADDIETLEKVLPELRRIGNGTVGDLHRCLKRAGALDES